MWLLTFPRHFFPLFLDLIVFYFTIAYLNLCLKNQGGIVTRLSRIPRVIARSLALLKPSGVLPDSKSRVQLAKAFFSAGMRHSLGIKDRAGFLEVVLPNEKINGNPIKIQLRHNKSDLRILQEIFFSPSYEIDSRKIPGGINSILDLGANTGISSVYLSSKFPGARLECVEPISENTSVLRRNLKNNGISARIHEFAVGSENGTREITIEPGQGDHSFYRKGANTRTVNQLRIDELSGKFDLIKIDIEGAEYDLLDGGKNTLLGAKCLVGELHNRLLGKEKSDKVMSFLNEHFDVKYTRVGRWLTFVAYRKQ